MLSFEVNKDVYIYYVFQLTCVSATVWRITQEFMDNG